MKFADRGEGSKKIEKTMLTSFMIASVVRYMIGINSDRSIVITGFPTTADKFSNKKNSLRKNP